MATKEVVIPAARRASEPGIQCLLPLLELQLTNGIYKEITQTGDSS
jgi:hypothetical protein